MDSGGRSGISTYLVVQFPATSYQDSVNGQAAQSTKRYSRVPILRLFSMRPSRHGACDYHLVVASSACRCTLNFIRRGKPRWCQAVTAMYGPHIRSRRATKRTVEHCYGCPPCQWHSSLSIALRTIPISMFSTGLELTVSRIRTR